MTFIIIVTVGTVITEMKEGTLGRVVTKVKAVKVHIVMTVVT